MGNNSQIKEDASAIYSFMEISSTNHVHLIECKNQKKEVYTSPGMSQKQITFVKSTNMW